MRTLFHHTFKEWWIAIRPWSFPASVVPVAVTMLYFYWVDEEVYWGQALFAIVDMALFHAAGNTWSDYFDYRRGVDAQDTYGVQTLTSGMFKPCEILTLSIVLLVLAVAGGLFLVWCTDWPLLAVGACGVVCSLLYPPLKYHALGDLVIFLDFAVLPTLGSAYVATFSWRWEALYLAVPLGLVTVAILHANNTRDMFTDHRARIVTLAMLLGGKWSSWLYQFEVLFPFVWVIGCAFKGVYPIFSLLSIFALIPALENVFLVRSRWGVRRDALSKLDMCTARLQLVFGGLLGLSFLMDVCVSSLVEAWLG